MNCHNDAFNKAKLICLVYVLQILSVSAIVLANLCVSYIMTSANEEVCAK